MIASADDKSQGWLRGLRCRRVEHDAGYIIDGVGNEVSSLSEAHGRMEQEQGALSGGEGRKDAGAERIMRRSVVAGQTYFRLCSMYVQQILRCCLCRSATTQALPARARTSKLLSVERDAVLVHWPESMNPLSSTLPWLSHPVKPPALV